MDAQQQFDDEIDLIDCLKVIYKRRRMVITLVFAGMVCAGIFSLLQPNRYEASATFFPMNVRQQYGAQPEGTVLKRQIDIEDLIVSILESKKMAYKIIEELKLKDIWKTKTPGDAIKILRGSTKITLGKNGLIKLTTQAESQELSAQIANAYVDNLEYFNSQLDIGAQKQIVQVIDRATVPETRMSRGTIKNVMRAGIIFFIFSLFMCFFLEFIQKSDIRNKLKET